MFQQIPREPVDSCGQRNHVCCVSWGRCSSHSCQIKCFTQMCRQFYFFQDISPCVGGDDHCGNSFSIRKEKPRLAKTGSPRERWAQHPPKSKDILVSPPEWHRGFAHPCVSLRTFKGSKLWSSPVLSATSRKVLQGIGLRSRASIPGSHLQPHLTLTPELAACRPGVFQALM